MKKIILALAVLFTGALAFAESPWAYPPRSVFFNTASGGPVLFSSASISFIGVTISSPTAAGKIIIYRSTSATFTLDIQTQTIINTQFTDNSGGVNQVIPLYNMTNTSYTYINRTSAAEGTLWFRCVGQDTIGVCPGLNGLGK